MKLIIRKIKDQSLWHIAMFAVLSAMTFALPISASETIDITVFEDHNRYVEASESYGLSWKIFELAAEQANYQLQLQPSSWRASMKRVQDSKVDLVFGALKTTEREEWASLSLPLIPEGSAIFTQLDNPVNHFDDIDLENSAIGVSAGSLQETLAKELGFKNIYSTASRPQLYDMLKGNRLDYLFFGTSIINYYCINFDTSATSKCMKQVSEEYYPNSVHVLALSNNSAAVKTLSRINHALFSLRHSEKTKAIFKQYANSKKLYQDWLHRVNAQKPKID